jgi:hypothetical protein
LSLYKNSQVTPSLIFLVVVMSACSGAEPSNDADFQDVQAGDVAADLTAGDTGDNDADGSGSEAVTADTDGEDGGDVSTDDALTDTVDRDQTTDDEAGDEGADIDMTTDSDLDGVPDYLEKELGTDPHNPDSDFDGISDGDELEDGTGPADPSSARAWHPELNTHPRLFFDATDIPAIQAKFTSPNAAMATLISRIRAYAGSTLPTHPEGGFDIYIGQRRGEIAENAAFLALIEEDTAMLNKAVTAFVEGYVDPKTANLAMDSDFDLGESEALIAFCSAWDYLAGNPAADAETIAAVRAALQTRIDNFRYMVHEEGPLFLMMLFARNNHVLKVWSSFGLCAMALNDRPTAASDLSEAMTGIDYVFNGMQASPDGGVAEGYHYLTYGSDTYLPLYFAWHRWADGAAFPFKAISTIQPDNPVADRVVEIPDFVTNQTTRNTYRLALESVTPNGTCPPVDDSNGTGQNGAMLANLFEDPDFLWQWYKPAVGLYSSNMNPLTLVAYDGAEGPAQPDAALDFVKYDAGMAVFRQDWSEQSLYLYLSGEHDAMRVNGLGHEHPDELSFLVQAFGRPLIIDAGYINFVNHAYVFRPKDHNTILVDGNGSPFGDLAEQGLSVGTDAYLSCIETWEDLSWASVSTAYEDVELQRRIVRVEQDFFIVEDRLAAADAHEYTFLLNGMGGGTTPDSTFELKTDGAVWTNGTPAVRAIVVPLSGTAATSSALEEHNSPSWGQWLMHERLAVKATMEPDAAGFVSVVLPAPTMADLQTVQTFSLADGVAGMVVTTRGGTPYIIISAAYDFTATGDQAEIAGEIIGFCKKGLTIIRATTETRQGGRVSIDHWIQPATGSDDCATGTK